MSGTEHALKAELKRLTMLRQDAIARGFQDAAIAYGWSALRVSEEIIQHKLAGLKRP